MILHILNTDKFTEYVILQFAAPEMQSKLVVLSFGDEDSQRFSNVDFIRYGSSEYIALKNNLSVYKAIIFHGLFEPWCTELIVSAPHNLKIAWVFWGGEVYGRQDIADSFLAKKTYKAVFWHRVKRFLGYRPKRTSYEVPLSCYRRIDYCLTDVDEDFEYIQTYSGNKKMKALWYNYYSVEETIGSLMDVSCSGKNILVGNSSSPECNYFEAFDALTELSLEDRAIVVPLSYGEPWLSNRVRKVGYKYFTNFQPLLEFMPREEYNKIICSCSVVVMNHYRPQAMGNLLTALWLGARVYMSKKSLLYKFFCRIGCLVWSVEDDLKASNPHVLAALTNEEREHNRCIIRSIYDKDVMHRKNLELVSLLNA